jgi:peptide/nickel transport system ATP-binding protein
MIFQDPMTSLNPVFTIEEQMVDRQLAHGAGGGRAALRSRAAEILTRVGIPDADRRLRQYPHEFSGGMRQRIMVAMALLTRPALLIADEPTSALDVTLEAQIIDLVRGLRDELGTAILYITHDLGVVAQLCDRVLVMYAGNVVESGDVYGVFEQPQHPYTRALLQSHPARVQRRARLVTIPGRVPSLRDLPAGCKFAPRCTVATMLCHNEEPRPIRYAGQTVLCHAIQDPAGFAAAAAAPAGALSESPLAPRLLDAARLLEVSQLRVNFADRRGLFERLTGQAGAPVRAVDGVDIYMRRGETLALVGESGSGKTTIGRTALRLLEPTGGTIAFEGQDITRLSQSGLRPARARMQMIFQDPVSSLSPRMKVSAILTEPFRIHGAKVDARRKVPELLEMVGLAAEQADKYPHQLSGGQARRVGIARALALNPDLLVADEPTAGLDVSVAAGILNLLVDLRERLNLTYLIITHNLNIITFIADRVAVMYLGQIVELAPTEELLTRPRHPYTEALLSAVAVPDPRLRDRQQRIILQGEIPSPRNPPPGCRFHPRCRYAEARCAKEPPSLRPLDGGEHLAACHYAERITGAGWSSAHREMP